MKDRFSFRAWNKKEKKYIDDIQECDNGYGVGEPCRMCFGDYLYECETYEVEQCTGFKDCNEDLMFVGDIIKVCIETDDTAFGYDVIGNFVIIEENGQLLAVNAKCYSKYINCEGTFYENDVCPLGWICDNDPEIEVLGNIHENSELLEAE